MNTRPILGVLNVFNHDFDILYPRLVFARMTVVVDRRSEYRAATRALNLPRLHWRGRIFKAVDAHNMGATTTVLDQRVGDDGSATLTNYLRIA